jgi:hypothetical protein
MTTVAPAVVLNAQDDLFLWPNYLGTHRTQISCTVSDSLHLEERFRQGHRVANCCAQLLSHLTFYSNTITLQRMARMAKSTQVVRKRPIRTRHARNLSVGLQSPSRCLPALGVDRPREPTKPTVQVPSQTRYHKSTIQVESLGIRPGKIRKREPSRSQFLFRNGEARAAAIQADQKLREYPDAGFVQILESGEMDDHLSGELPDARAT